MAICPAGQAAVCLGGRVLLGPLGPMVRGRALVPGALGSACLLPPHGCGCQPQSHVCIPKVPTGRIGKLRLGKCPAMRSWNRWLARQEGEDRRPASGHHTHNPISPGGVRLQKDNPRHRTSWGCLCYPPHMSSGRSPVLVVPNLGHRSSHQGSAQGKRPRNYEAMGSFLGSVP